VKKAGQTILPSRASSSQGREIALVAAVRHRASAGAAPASTRVPRASAALMVLVASVLLPVLLGHGLLLHGADWVHVVLVRLVLLLLLLRVRLVLLLLLLLDGHDVRLLLLLLLLLLLCRSLLGKLRLRDAVPHGHALHVRVLLVVTEGARIDGDVMYISRKKRPARKGKTGKKGYISRKKRPARKGKAKGKMALMSVHRCRQFGGVRPTQAGDYGQCSSMEQA